MKILDDVLWTKFFSRLYRLTYYDAPRTPRYPKIQIKLFKHVAPRVFLNISVLNTPNKLNFLI